MSATTGIQPGDVWESRGERPRRVTVIDADPQWSNGYVTVQGKRRSSIRRRAFVRSYDLVSRATTDDRSDT